MSLPLKSRFHSSVDWVLLLLLQLLIMNDDRRRIMIENEWRIVIEILFPKIVERRQMLLGERLRNLLFQLDG
jgi:hypothetical protein